MSSLILASGKLRFSLVRRGDRFMQLVEWADSPQAVELLVSTAERCKEDQENWPASPPWQDAHAEAVMGKPSAILAVGKAGKSHWSLSVEPSPAGFLFDVACRVKELPQWLGSTYRRSPEFVACPLEFRVVELAENPGVTCETRGDLVRVVVPVAEGPWPRTIRWKYEIRVFGG